MASFMSRVGVCMLSHFSHVPFFVTPWTIALPGSSVQGILPARILEWVAMLSSRGSSQPRDRTLISCIAGRFFGQQATWKDLIVCSLPKLEKNKKASHEVQIIGKGVGLYQGINPRGWGPLKVACHHQSCIQSWKESIGSIRTESSMFKAT